MAPTPYLNDRSRKAATIAAAIALVGKVDGDIITTTSREEAGDGGGATYIYRAAGREAITEDGWRYFDGDGESDYLELLSPTEEIDLREWGSLPSSGDISTLCQNAITNCPEHSGIKIPSGEYEIADLVIPDTKVMHILGKGGKLTAAAGASYMLDFGADTRRNAPLTISGLEFHGDSQSVVGLKTSGRTNVILSGLSVKYCMTAGIDLILAYNVGLVDCVIERNYVGLKVRQTADGGGGNANTFRNVELYLNTIGAIWDGTDSAYPQENNSFFGGTIQGNTLCGVATFATGNLIFHGTHFESNGSAGSTATVDSNVVRKSSCHFHSSSVRLNSVSPGSDNPFVTLESSSTLHIDGMHTYGVTGQLVKDYDATSEVILTGRVVARGSIDAKTLCLPEHLDWQGNFSCVSDPILSPSTVPTNLASTTNKPVPANTDGATLNADVVDSVHGPTTSVTFAASVGSSSSNRCILPTNFGTLTSGEHFAVTVLVKTDSDTRLRFDVTSGSYASIEYTLRDTEWQKVTLIGTAGSTNTPALYVYPLDDAGATVQFAKLQVVKEAAADRDKIHRVINETLYNDNTSGFTTGSDANLTLTSNSKRRLVYPASVPVSGFRTVTLPAAGVVGDPQEITRLDSGDGTLYLYRGGLLLSKKQWAQMLWDGTSWVPMQSGGAGTIVTPAEYLAADADLVNRWNADDSPADVEGSDNLTWSGTPAYEDGPANAVDGRAFLLDGSTNYLTAPSTVGDYTDDFTVAFWVKHSSASAQRLISKRDGAGAWDISLNSNLINFYNGAGTFTFSGAGSVPQDTWTHVALIIDGTACKLVINGVQKGADFTASLSSSGSDLFFGRYPLASQDFLDGSLADIRLITRALSVTECYMLTTGGT